MISAFRNTTEFLLPVNARRETSEYNIYPSFRLAENLIFADGRLLAGKLAEHSIIIIDCYSGVFIDRIRENLEGLFQAKKITTRWVNVEDALKPENEIDRLISPFLGDPGSIFGKKATLSLSDFFDQVKLGKLQPDPEADVNIIYGPGAALAGWEGFLVYADLPKNEIQYRAKAKAVFNLGLKKPGDFREMYKRFYFVDWVVLNRHKKKILSNIGIIVDDQQTEKIIWMEGDSLRGGLKVMSHNFFRVRPWFEPGVWGGNWIKQHISGINTEVENYAWSFELITPENGILFESSSILIEVSFDFLMYSAAESVLGSDYEKFRDEFPIRFDFLDTFDGGNLSIQCHPQSEFARERFGEILTQEETYYILDCKNDATVYLGFQEDIEPVKFKKSLEKSLELSRELTISDFVQVHPAKRHDLFLIPPGTVHGSGRGNLVLEISTTPYIYTFKMYDWVRPDLDGKPRPLNIEYGMENLCFERKGETVKKELISAPVLIEEGDDWKLFELPTHEKHTYRIFRYHFDSKIMVKTENKCHVLNLTEGISVNLKTEAGLEATFHYAETFVIPAAAKSYCITNNHGNTAIVVIALMK